MYSSKSALNQQSLKLQSEALIEMINSYLLNLIHIYTEYSIYKPESLSNKKLLFFLVTVNRHKIILGCRISTLYTYSYLKLN